MKKNNPLNQTMTTADLQEVLPELTRVWLMIAPDAGPCSTFEASEMVLERVGGSAGKIVDELIGVFGYKAVRRVTAETLFGR